MKSACTGIYAVYNKTPFGLEEWNSKLSLVLGRKVDKRYAPEPLKTFHTRCVLRKLDLPLFGYQCDKIDIH